MSEKPDLIDRFFAKVDTSGECWLWTGAKQFRVGDAKVHPRRFAYELRNDPTDIRLDVMCGELWCVNPDHIIEYQPVHHEHGTYRRYNNGCRCRQCREANNNRHRDLRAELAERAKDPDDPRHGQASFYRNHGCRCAKCKEAHSKDLTMHHQKRVANIDPDDPRHGKSSFYFGHGCRCAPCKKAGANYQRAKKVA